MERGPILEIISKINCSYSHLHLLPFNCCYRLTFSTRWTHLMTSLNNIFNYIIASMSLVVLSLIVFTKLTNDRMRTKSSTKLQDFMKHFKPKIIFFKIKFTFQKTSKLFYVKIVILFIKREMKTFSKLKIA